VPDTVPDTVPDDGAVPDSTVPDSGRAAAAAGISLSRLR
jgi:hypothetical protein